MSLYHETANILTGPSTRGGSLRTRIYGNKDLKSPPAQIYALAFESSKWSVILKEVVENSQLLQSERKLTPALSILLVHDLLLAKKGIALPASHGLRVAIEKHKARLQSEFTRARIRRKCATLEALKTTVDAQLGPPHPRWIRVNSLKSTVDDQLDTTFKGFEVVPTVEEVIASASTGKKVICLDGHVPNLIAASPTVDFTKTDAYKAGEIILQDKASCFPAYLLDPQPEDGDIIDACSAPGNKTTHLAGILHERGFARGQRILAFEKDSRRAQTLAKMVKTAGSDAVTVIHPGHDFLKTDPNTPEYSRVGALLLDPSCSGSGIVGRDDAPEFHLPISPSAPSSSNTTTPTPRNNNTTTTRKRKRHDDPSSKPTTTPTPPSQPSQATEQTQPEDDPDSDSETDHPLPTTLPASTLATRLASLASFQLTLLLHAFTFPAATRISYSTCSVHAAENEAVVLAALRSDVARARGWRVLRRDEQVRGMREWDVRGDLEACEGDAEVAGGCVRAGRGDGRGVMGFFVVCFVREEKKAGGGGGGGGGGKGREVGGEGKVDDDGPYVRDAEGRIVRGADGIPTLKSTGKPVEVEDWDRGEEDDGSVELRFGEEDGDEEDGPFERDGEGRIVRGPDGMPRLKARRVDGDGEAADEGHEEEDDEWGGFDD